VTVTRISRPPLRGRRFAAIALALAVVPAFAGAALAKGGPGPNGNGANVAAVRQVTEKYHDVSAAIADGYIPFYRCTEQPGVGTMGQHYVKLALVGDPAVDPLQPEALVYEPTRSGDLRLAAVEYVTFAADWHKAFGADNPTVLGQDMLFRPAGNRFGLPDFYERHAWIWQGNSAGLFSDWNPHATCLGTGDNGG
jgi:hypothetical protein